MNRQTIFMLLNGFFTGRRAQHPKRAHAKPKSYETWYGLLTVLTLLGLSASGAAYAVTELKLESWRKDDQIFWSRKILPVFHKQHPDIRITFAPENPLEYDSRLDAKLTSRQAGDLIFCRPYDGNVRLIERKQLAPLPSELLQNFSSQARRPWSSEDGQTTYCIPVAQVVHGVFYNKNLMREIGAQPPQTVQEFFTLLERIKAHGKYVPFALGLADMWESTQVLFTGAGPNFWHGEKGRQNLIRAQARFTDKEYLEAWQFMARLWPYMPSTPHEVSNTDAQVMFATEQAVLFPTGSWDIPFMRYTYFSHRKANLVDFGAFRFPIKDPAQRCQVSAHPDFGIGMNAQTPHKAAAQQFLQWLGTAEFAQLMTNELSGFYSLSSHEVKVSDPVGQDMLNWRDECDQTIRLDSEKLDRTWPSLQNELWYVNVKVLDGSMSPQEAAKHIQKIHERNMFIQKHR